MMFRTFITTGRTATAMTDGEKLHNPLPDPIQGRRDEMEFPLDEKEPGDWDTSDTTSSEGTSTEAADANASAASAAVAEDDFDMQIAEDDDFDV